MKLKLITLLFCLIRFTLIDAQSLEVFKTIPRTTCNTCIEYGFDGGLTLDKISEANLPDKFVINHDIIASIDNIEFSSNNLSVIDDMEHRKYLMAYYHLFRSLEYSESLFGADVFNLLVFDDEYNNAANPPKPTFDVSKYNDNDGQYMIDYSYVSSGYNPVAEDAFVIASGLFAAHHLKLIQQEYNSGDFPSGGEGLDYAISSYFALNYLHDTGLTEPYNYTIFMHGGIESNSTSPFRWETLDVQWNHLVHPFLYETSFIDLANQPRSALFTTVLLRLEQEIGSEKLNSLLIGSLPHLNQSISKQWEAAEIIYESLVGENTDGSLFLKYGLTGEDQCEIYDLFESVYSSSFADEVDVNKLPSFLSSGDIHIADNPTDIGVEPHSGDVCNSPDIWNRRSSTGFASNENQKARLDNGTINSNLNFLYVKINGDLCDLTSAQSPTSNMYLKVYYNTAIGTTWAPETSAHDWEHDDATEDHHIYGDLIGTIDLNTLNCVYDDLDDITGLPMEEVLTAQKQGDYTIIQIPWKNYIDENSTYAKKLHHDFGYLARLTSEGTTPFDPISTTEGQNVISNTKNNNNIALRRNVIYVCTPGPDGFPNGGVEPPIPGIILTGDPDPIDPEIRLTIRPASHDPEPVDPDPNDPVLPEFPVPQVFNDYINYGDVVIVLDPDLFTSWTTGGQRGTGFTINADNEIIVNDRDFYLEGLSLPGRDIYEAIRVKFAPHTSTLEKRTAFDLVQWGSLSGKVQNAVHVEVRPGDNSSTPRRAHTSEDISDNVSIYPNPAQDYFTLTSDQTEISNIEIYNIRNERMNVSYNSVDAKTTRVNVEPLSSGIYFIRVQRAKNIETIKFVKF